jgi:hypothetical protein
MVAAALLEPFEKEAKERQIESGGDRKSEKSVVENLPQPKSTKRNPPATDKAAEALKVLIDSSRLSHVSYFASSPSRYSLATSKVFNAS